MTRRTALVLAVAAAAVLGPALAALGVVRVAALGSPLPVPLAGGLAALVLVAIGAAAVRLDRRLGAGAVAADLVLLLFLHGFCGAPLPAPPPLAGELPPASPPAEMAAFQLPTGVIHRTAAFAYRGGGFSDRRDFVMTAVLISHPRGDLLIDTGVGRDLVAQLAAMPLGFRAGTRVERGVPAADQLAAAGHDRARLRGVLLTHAHWDHVSGLPDLPGVPVLVTAAERAFIDRGGWVMDVARRARAVPYQLYTFDGPPYLGFPASHDVYGDGAIVVVPAPGHTPGSVIVFVTLPGARRFAFVGDLVWQREGITLREERPWAFRRSADDDPAGVRSNLIRMAAIAARFPEITLVPAHDPRGFASLPRLSR